MKVSSIGNLEQGTLHILLHLYFMLKSAPLPKRPCTLHKQRSNSKHKEFIFISSPGWKNVKQIYLQQIRAAVLKPHTEAKLKWKNVQNSETAHCGQIEMKNVQNFNTMDNKRQIALKDFTYLCT